ncbi:MAG: hypothetical protein EA353_11065 [Puniceicoccaceae bacterium]|nr:MAG: hypothetical protein EA353_11065 [Puniceicoccaceae bacterium]
MNQTVITGNLTADIETRDIQSTAGEPQHLSKFTLASNEGERVVFMPVQAWNMPHLAEYLFKGSKALISGSLKQENWETEAGDKRSRFVLTAYKVEFLDPAPAGDGAGAHANRANTNKRANSRGAGSHGQNRSGGARRSSRPPARSRQVA